MTSVDYILTTDAKFHHFDLKYEQESVIRVSQTAQELKTSHHMELTEHDHLYMFEQTQRDLQIGKHVLSILQSAIEMF